MPDGGDSPAGVAAEIEIADPRWGDHDTVAPLVERAIAAVFAILEEPEDPSLIDVQLTDDAAIAAINSEWRGKDGPTNVLSFPAAPMAPVPGDPAWRAPLGDLVLAFDTITREAALDNKPFDHHVTHLVIHGVLHLLGYDHVNDDDAETMEQLEREILDRLAIPDPYDD